MPAPRRRIADARAGRKANHITDVSGTQKNQSTAGTTSRLLLNKLDLISVRIGHKRNHRGSVFHRTGLTHDRAALLLDLLARGIRVINLNRRWPKQKR